MKRTPFLVIAIVTILLAILGSLALAQQDKCTLQVPGGLAFSELRGYEAWQVVSISHDGDLLAAILANSVMIDAYLAGVSGNGKPFPDGAAPWSIPIPSRLRYRAESSSASQRRSMVRSRSRTAVSSKAISTPTRCCG